jgi:hypothetical protein
VVTSDGYTVSNGCFDPSLIQTMNSLCDTENHYLAQVPVGYTPSFVDLRGNYLQADLHQENFARLITSALQQIGVSGKGK